MMNWEFSHRWTQIFTDKNINTQTKMKNKITVIHHSADFDGLFCREIAKKFLGTEGVEYIGWDFADPPLAIPSEGTIYIMDLPVDRVFGINLNLGVPHELQPRLIWIDHHKSSIETHPAEIPGYRIDGVAACRLAWQWFWLHEAIAPESFPPLPAKQDFIDHNVTEPYAVQLAGEYDIWDKRNPDAEVFQFGLRSRELEQHHWKALLLDGAEAHDAMGSVEGWLLDQMLDNGRLLQRYQQEQDKSIVERLTFLVEFEGLKFLALNSPRFNSLTFAAKDVPETDHDALMGFRWDGQAWTVSLYHAKHNTGIDLSVIAAKFGGGGHRGACGFRLPHIGGIFTLLGCAQPEQPSFEQEIRETINRHSMENGSNTPDFILSCFLTDALQAFDKAVKQRAQWHGHETELSTSQPGPNAKI